MNPVFPTLYSRTSTGAVQMWKIVVEGDSYHTISGQVDGKQVTSKPTVAKPKNVGKANETTGEDQAAAEAAAKLKKKKDSGYKENIKDVDESTFVEPMLAKDYKDRSDDVVEALKAGERIYFQPKLDGMRCIVHKGGMFSRNGKPILSAPHIFEAVQPLFKKNPNLIMDGELYADKFVNDFNSLMSLAKQAKPTEEDFAKSKASLQYHVYDMVHPRMKFSERYDFIAAEIATLKTKCIVAVETTYSKKLIEINKAYEEYIERGYEGQMIRLDAPYENKRSKYLLKRKEFITEEYKILDVIEGDGNRAGTAGYCWLQNLKGRKGDKFKSNIKGSHEFCTQVLKKKDKYIGKMATVKYFNLTPDLEVPRFPYIVELDRQDI